LLSLASYCFERKEDIASMERRAFLALLAAAAATAHSSAFARTKPVKDFRAADLIGGEFAMRSSQTALARSKNPDILTFANEEIAEQTQVAAALQAAPGSAPLRSDHAKLAATLEATPAGPSFDRIYVQGQLLGHQELFALNTSYLKSGDTQFRQVAEMSVPIIQRHLSILNGLRSLA
jgi:putative membrane protein